MNIAQVLGIAIATFFYVLSVDEPWSARFAVAHAEICTMAAEAEAVGETVLARSEAFVLAALQQNAPLDMTL